MHAEILAIGTELVSGQKIDTNSAWLSTQLSELGIDVKFVSVLGDDMSDNLAALRISLARSPLILIGGGLGPTQDDLTRDVVAAAAGAPLIESAEGLRHIEEFFAHRQRAMPERNRLQALLPQGADLVPNRVGTAPGIWMAVGKSRIGCLPGVPRELKIMFKEQIAPRIAAWHPATRVVLTRKINLFGLGESEVEALAMDLTARGREPEVGITAHEATISFRIRAEGANAEIARRSMEDTLATIRERFGTYVLGEEDTDVAEALAEQLQRTGTTVALAESCTGGLASAFLTEVPGISAHFLGGVVSYANSAKSAFLDVPSDLIESQGAVSPETAIAMAQGARDRFGADLAVSITGIAGPDGGSSDKPVGLVYLGFATKGGNAHRKLLLGAEQPRAVIRLRAAKLALNWLRLHLMLHNPADAPIPPDHSVIPRTPK